MRSEFLKHIYLGASLSLFLRIAGTGVMFVALILLARALPADDFGLYIYTVDLVALIAPIASFGLSQICVRVVSDAISDGNEIVLRAYRRAALGLAFISALLFWVALEIAKYFSLLPMGLNGWLVPLSSALLFAISALRIAQEMLRAARRIGLSQVVEQLLWPFILAVLAACGLWGFVRLSIMAIIGSHIIVMAIAGFLLFFTFQKLFQDKMSKVATRKREDQLQEWLIVGIPLAISGGFSLIQYRGDIIALGAFAEQSELGPYAAAVRLAGLIIFALGAVAAATEPLMRQFHVAGEKQNLQLVVDRGATISTIMSLPVAVPLMLFPDLFLSLFGPTFVKAAPALSILALGQLVNAMTGPISPLIIALGLQRINLYVMVVIGFGLLIGLVLAVPNFGMVGAATVTAISAIMLNCTLARIIYARIGIKTYFRLSGLHATISDVRMRFQ